MDEDEKLRRITRLLEQGCTMLAVHHDCGAPLFRCQGEVVCPVCSFKEDVSYPAAKADLPGQEESGSFDALHSQEAIRKISSEENVPKKVANGRHHDDEWDRAREHLRSSLLQKLEEITVAMQEEQDLDKLKRQLDCIVGLLGAFRSLDE
ncbi:Sjogren's syndrome/scleroderma autoantigen 1 (Autoantigen p27) [uncultured archaeon]|nr:Sjogren's syndrome/scleroderma autoantigen 1 (Autoantigen p27) [uncultured archaeon]